jgi:multidrug resistance efflux pump
MTTPRDFEAEIAEAERALEYARRNRNEAQLDVMEAEDRVELWDEEMRCRQYRLDRITLDQCREAQIAQSRKAGGK